MARPVRRSGRLAPPRARVGRPPAGRAEVWYETLITSLNDRTMSVGRFGCYRRILNEFVDWVRTGAAIEPIDSATLEAWYAELSGRVAAGTTSPDYARNIFGATKMFILLSMLALAACETIAARR